jgi:hypothetical protein
MLIKILTPKEFDIIWGLEYYTYLKSPLLQRLR